MNNTIQSSFALLISMLVLACGNPSGPPAGSQTAMKEKPGELRGQTAIVDNESQMDILRVAISSKDHTTLVTAVQAAAMEHVLSNPGPLTVFAPTNAAFDKLPAGTVQDLLKAENKGKLADIITYHAAPGNYDANNIKGVMGIGQATGDKVKVEVKDGVTTVNGARVLGTVKASNGYVHIIDSVLLPPD